MIENVSIEVGTVTDPAAGVGLDTAEQISAFEQILQRFEQNTLTERDKGTAFELLVRGVLSQAQPWCDQFAKVQTYAEWAKEHPELSGGDARDTGIDLVATNRSPAGGQTGIQTGGNDGLAQNAGLVSQVRIKNRGGGRDFSK